MRISRVVPVFDRNAIGVEFEFARVRSSEPSIKRGAAILDLPAQTGGIEATCFDGRSAVWIMARRGSNIKLMTRQLIKGSGDESLAAETLGAAQVPDRELLLLLLASLAKSRFGTLSCSNVGGRLLVVNPAHVKRNGLVMHALEVGLSKDMCLTLRVRTFTSLSLKKYIRKGRIGVDKLPRYELLGGKFLRRSFDRGPDDPKAFVERAVGGGRYRISFLDVSNEERFYSSKMGILDEVVQRLEERFLGMAELGFVELEDRARLECRSTPSAKWREGIARALHGAGITIIDSTKDNGKLAMEVARRIQEVFDVPATVSEFCVPGGLSIRLIHEKSYYEGREDPYSHVPEGAVVQHVTIEAAEAKDEIPGVIVESSVKELLVKSDVARGQVTLVDWASLDIEGAWSFGLRIPAAGPDDADRYAFVDINPEGSMRFALEEQSFFDGGEHDDMVSALAFNRQADIAIRGGDGSVNVVISHDLYAIPAHEKIRVAFKNAGKVGRDASSRKLLFADVTDIAFAKAADGSCYYRVGIVGYGMNRKIANASLLKEVKAESDGEILFPEALELLDVDFVRMRELSITPFPIKYLREWVKMKYPAFAEAV